MTLDTQALQERLSSAVAGDVEVRPFSAGVARVEAPFAFADGDHLVIRLREANGHYEWSDFGHTLMHLSYEMDVDTIDSGKRAELFEHALSRSGVEEREGELVLSSHEEELGVSLLRFAQALIHVSDLDYLTQERVRSTFVEDVKRLMRERFAERAHLDYIDPEQDKQGQYPIDCLLNQARQPVAVFAVGNDDHCRDATITLQEFRAWERPLFSTAIFADQEQINRRVLARFSNAVDKQFSSFVGQEDEIVEYLARTLG